MKTFFKQFQQTILFGAIMILPIFLTAQTGVGIGTTTPDASAILDIKSTSQGVLVPRLTAYQIANMSIPATSLLVYQTNGKEGFYYNEGTPTTPVWKRVGDEAEWSGGQKIRTSTGYEYFAVPDNVTRIYFEIAGGGGGCGGTYDGGSNPYRGGGGGGGGGFLFGYIDVTPGEVLKFTVGSPGTNGTSGTTPTDGTDGVATEISSGSTLLASATGGKQGKASSSSNSGSGGSGGIPTWNVNRTHALRNVWFSSLSGGTGNQGLVANKTYLTGEHGIVASAGDFNSLTRRTLATTSSNGDYYISSSYEPTYGCGGGSGYISQPTQGYAVWYW